LRRHPKATLDQILVILLAQFGAPGALRLGVGAPVVGGKVGYQALEGFTLRV